MSAQGIHRHFLSFISSPYRAPELCLHASSYGPAVDIWSMGMVFAEVLLHGRLIQVETDVYKLCYSMIRIE